MKPDKKICRFCGKEVDGKKLYCDDAHRMAWKRQQTEHLDNPNTNKPEQIAPEQQVEQTDELTALRATLTKTDKTFFDRAIRDFKKPDHSPDPYYRFDGPERKAKCGFCGADFTTNLSLNRYCSYKHYAESLEVIK